MADIASAGLPGKRHEGAGVVGWPLYEPSQEPWTLEGTSRATQYWRLVLTWHPSEPRLLRGDETYWRGRGSISNTQISGGLYTNDKSRLYISKSPRHFKFLISIS